MLQPPLLPSLLAAGVGSLVLSVATCPSQSPKAPDQTVLCEGFEGALPRLHTHQARYTADTPRAHGGRQSLRVTPTSKSGGAYFRLDSVVDRHSDYEFSAWVYAGKSGTVSLYISAASDGRQRQTRGQVSGGLAGRWVQLVGQLRGKDWQANDREVMLAMRCSAESWFDDVVLRKTKLPEPPIDVYPGLVRNLHAAADRSAVRLTAGAELTLEANRGALAFGLETPRAIRPESPQVVVPPDGLLSFAVDVPAPLYVTGSLRLVPDADLRPGLRAYVLSDDTVVAAPMVRAEPWEGEGNPLTGPAPNVTGTRPASDVQLATWLLPAGRHYLTVAGPHFRPAGRFQQLRLRALARPVETPVYQFALLSDTHVGSGRGVWMNTKLDGPAGVELTATLAALKREGIAWAVIAGDMTNHSEPEQYATLDAACRKSGLLVYGCVGNHDAYQASSRQLALETCAALFPAGKTDYVIHRPPLQLIVLDGAHWQSKNGQFMDHYDAADFGNIGLRPEQIQWLKRELARDTKTPTAIVWHFPCCRDGLSSCGYKMPAIKLPAGAAAMLAALRQAPNVVAVLCGHTHWNEYNWKDGIAHVVNPAFCEWPNAYRVFRVYQDRMEWELRQVPNRGFVRESFVPRKASSWMISTAADDLTGTVPLRRVRAEAAVPGISVRAKR